MFAYIVRRLALMLVTLFGISVIIFVLLRVVPGNIVDILFDAAGFVDPADKANLEKELGLDQSIFVQYVQWIGGLLHGDLGYSYVSEKPALQEILPRIPITARLAALALLFSASIGIPLGVISAVKQGTRLDYALRVVSLSGLSLPSFWLGLLILMASVAMFGTMPIFNPNPATWTEAFAIYCRPGNGRRLSQRRADHADHALVDARNIAAGLYPHRPRQGRVRVLRQLSPCAEERRAARHHRDRHRGGVPDRRPDRHRDRVQYSGRRPLPGRGDPLARLPDRPEPGDADRPGRRGHATSRSTCSTP